MNRRKWKANRFCLCIIYSIIFSFITVIYCENMGFKHLIYLLFVWQFTVKFLRFLSTLHISRSIKVSWLIEFVLMNVKDTLFIRYWNYLTDWRFLQLLRFWDAQSSFIEASSIFSFQTCLDFRNPGIVAKNFKTIRFWFSYNELAYGTDVLIIVNLFYLKWQNLGGNYS